MIGEVQASCSVEMHAILDAIMCSKGLMSYERRQASDSAEMATGFDCCVHCVQDDWDEEAHPEGFILGGSVPPPAPTANGDPSEAGTDI